jgi:diadenosine tetraphosphate (Ap4A) HIT family hydrolase
MDAQDHESCPFCTVPATRIIEAGEHAFVIDDAFPVSPGHTLVVARRHVWDFFGLSAEETADVMRLVQSAKRRLDRDLDPAGYNIGINNGGAAGQTVMHVHVHLIPRFRGDVIKPAGGVRHVIPEKGHYP